MTIGLARLYKNVLQKEFVIDTQAAYKNACIQSDTRMVWLRTEH